MNDNKNDLLKNNDNDNLLKTNNKKNFLDIIIELIGKITLIILLILIIDYAYSLMFANKPLIVLSEENNKYSSIFYDMYICENSRVVKFKNENFSCVEVDGLPIDDNNDINNNSNNDNNNSTNNNINNENNNSINNNNSNNTTNNSNNNENNSNSNNNIIEEIITDKDNNITTDKTKIEDRSNGACAQAIEYYYEDNAYKYYFTCIKSNNIYVIKNNKEYTIKYALNNKIVTMQELIDNGFKPLKESKNLIDK